MIYPKFHVYLASYLKRRLFLYRNRVNIQEKKNQPFLLQNLQTIEFVFLSAVCRRYLDRYPADVDLFWEVEGTGGPYQRTRVAHKLNSRPLTGKYFDQIHMFSVLVSARLIICYYQSHDMANLWGNCNWPKHFPIQKLPNRNQ